MSGTLSTTADQEVVAFLEAIENPTRRPDALTLDALFREVTGWQPRMWGSIVGYGSYRYTYASGRSGESCATGFSPRKASLSIYIMPGYADFDEILADLGKHRRGKGCLYLNKLADVDTDVLKRLVRAGLDDLATHWAVTPS